MATVKLFGDYPKERSALPPEYAAVYLEHYRNNRAGGSLLARAARRAEGWMHRKVAADVGRSAGKSTLEIGAGTLNHLQYEPASAPYDIVEPFRQLYESAPDLPRVSHAYYDISEIPRDRKYDRIISVAVLEHVGNLPEVVARSGLLLDAGGQFRAGVPSEGTIPWLLCWKLITGVEFRIRYGLDYGVLMRHEHMNTAREVEDVLRHFFADVREDAFGPSKRLSLYQFFACSNPRAARCRDYLESRPGGAGFGAA